MIESDVNHCPFYLEIPRQLNAYFGRSKRSEVLFSQIPLEQRPGLTLNPFHHLTVESNVGVEPKQIVEGEYRVWFLEVG